MSFSSFDQPFSGQAFQTEAVVKWFNLTKGFGFVAPADGSSDAFMHSSVVSRAGMREVVEGTKLLVQITEGPKGRQVASIIEVLGVVEGGGHSGHMGSIGTNGFGAGRPAPTGPEVELEGIVKWFKPDKGFGFITPADGDRDVFVHRTVVQRAGLQELQTGEKVRMKVQTASKGREATMIEIIS